VSTPHVAEATISLPSAKLKYGGVRISLLDNRTINKIPAKIGGNRILPAAENPTPSQVLSRNRFTFFFLHFCLSSTLFVSLSSSLSLVRETIMPGRFLGVDCLDQSSSSAVNLPDEKNSSVIFKLEFESRMDPSSNTLSCLRSIFTHLELSDFYTSLSNAFVIKIKFLNFFTIVFLHILLYRYFYISSKHREL